MFEELGLHGLNGLLGNHAYNNYGQQGMTGSMNANSMAQQAQANYIRQQYNAQMAQQKKDWVFNGRTCSVREMADSIWPTDCPDKTHFLLKYE